RIEVADIDRDQFPAVIVLGNVVDGSGAAKPVHHAKANRVMIEHRGKHAAHSALLAPNLAADRLLIPKVAAIGSRDTAGVLGRLRPRRYPLNGAGLVDDPHGISPCSRATLSRRYTRCISFVAIEGIRPAVKSLYPMPRPVIGCAALAASYIASIRSRDRCAMPRPFLEQVSNCSGLAIAFIPPVSAARV